MTVRLRDSQDIEKQSVPPPRAEQHEINRSRKKMTSNYILIVPHYRYHLLPP
jgi:hypothetical protein